MAVITYRPENHENIAHSGLQILRKTADQIVNNDTVFQNDDHLSFPGMQVNEIWVIDGMLDVVTNTTSKIQLTFAIPNFAEGDGLWVAHKKGDNRNVVSSQSNTLLFRVTATTLNADHISVYALINISNTAGAITLQFSQETAQVFDTKILRNSWLRATRLDG